MPDFGRWNSAGGDPSLNEINRTDQFLDALAAQQPPYSTDRDEAELANLLAGWRDDVRETPMGHVLTPQDAAAALDRATRPAPRRRLSLAVLGSAAAAVLAIGGVGAVVAGSGPGDALYGLRTMFFGEQTQTRDDAVILAAQTEMQQVQQLIEQGDWQGAQAKLEAVTTTVATVDDIERKQELVTQWQELTVKVEAQDPAATIAPDAVLPTFPDVPVVILEPDAPVTGPTSETTDTPAPSETTSPSSTTETTSPSSATETTAPSSTAAPTSTTATQAPAPSTSVGHDTDDPDADERDADEPVEPDDSGNDPVEPDDSDNDTDDSDNDDGPSRDDDSSGDEHSSGDDSSVDDGACSAADPDPDTHGCAAGGGGDGGAGDPDGAASDDDHTGHPAARTGRGGLITGGRAAESGTARELRSQR